MNFRTLMQAGPAKANELFARLSETSDGAVKTREKLFTELKDELELHASLEEQHLFPILRRNAETKEVVTDAIKDNKELRAKLAELEALSKTDPAFPEQLKELQKSFRQHARDEKRELLPAVQRALSEEQVQGVAEKIEAGVAEAEQAKQDELEERRAKARQEREQAERQAAQREEAERAQKAAAAQAHQEELAQKRAKAQQEREQAERQAKREAAAKQAKEEAVRRVRDSAETAVQAAMATQTSALRVVESATATAQRVGEEMREAAGGAIDAVRTRAPDLQAVAGLPSLAVNALTEIRSAWMEWVGQTTRAGAQMSKEMLLQAVERQRRFSTEAVQGWVENNARVMQITMRMAQEGVRPFAIRPARSHEDARGGR